MAKSEQELAIEQMRQRLASAQAVLDMRGGGVVPQQPGANPNTDSVPAMVSGGDQIIPTRRTQLPETTLRGLAALPVYPTGSEDTGMQSREYAEQQSYMERMRMQYGLLPTFAAWGLGQAVSWGTTAALTAAVGAPIPTMGLGPAVMAGTLAAYGKMAGKQPVQMERGGIVPETMPGENVPAMLQPGEVVVPKRDGLSQTELFRAKMARENAGLPGIGTVPLPAREEPAQAANAQQTVSLPTTMVKPPSLPDQEELFRRKMALENRGLPTPSLAESLAYHRANYKPPELPQTMPIPSQDIQKHPMDDPYVMRGLTREEQGAEEQEQSDANQRHAGVSGGAGSLFGNVVRGAFNVATSNFQAVGRMGRLPGGFGSFGGDTGFSTRSAEGGNFEELKKAIETLTKAVDSLAKMMEQKEGAIHTQHNQAVGSPIKSSSQTQSPTKADKKSGIDPALIRQGAAVIARFTGMFGR